MRSARHVCPPCFEVVLGDDDEDFPRKIYADTAQDAAEKAAEESDYDDDGMRLLNGGEVEAKVTSFDGETEIYLVTGEVVPNYHAIKK
jgi:hypothetical protein